MRRACRAYLYGECRDSEHLGCELEAWLIKVKHETAPKNKKMIHDGSPEEAKTLGLFSFERDKAEVSYNNLMADKPPI